MAITIYSSPLINYGGYMPANNEQWFVAISDKVANPNFKYRVVITQFPTGQSLVYDIPPRPITNDVEFDALNFAKRFSDHFIPNSSVAINNYGFIACSNCLNTLNVNIGEVYGNTPVYYSGINEQYNVWNACLDFNLFAYYATNNLLYDKANKILNHLTKIKETVVYPIRSNYLYTLSYGVNLSRLTGIKIKSYLNGNQVGLIKTIPNPIVAATYGDYYTCIDVGLKGLMNIPSSLITGGGTALSNLADSYEVLDAFNDSVIMKCKIGCSYYTVYSLHYLNQYGGFDTLHCSLSSTSTSNKTTSTVKRNAWTRVNNIKKIDPSLTVERVVETSIQDTLKLTSNWLNESELFAHRDLFMSPVVYLDSGNGLVSVKVNSQSYSPVTPDFLRNITLEISFTYQSNRQ
jgi:hypothetical protein